jgi:site-specific recombinase XerD
VTTNLRRDGVHPKLISGMLGHSDVTLAMNVYDHMETEELRLPLRHVAAQLCPDVPKSLEVA